MTEQTKRSYAGLKNVTSKTPPSSILHHFLAFLSSRVILFFQVHLGPPIVYTQNRVDFTPPFFHEVFFSYRFSGNSVTSRETFSPINTLSFIISMKSKLDLPILRTNKGGYTYRVSCRPRGSDRSQLSWGPTFSRFTWWSISAWIPHFSGNPSPTWCPRITIRPP